MAEHNHQHDNDLEHQAGEQDVGEKLDAAAKSLSEALRMAFGILKVIMIVLVALFMLSGFEKVGSDEEAIVLRFGKIHRLLDSGLHWVFPYPIDEIVKIPVGSEVTIALDSFWYDQANKRPVRPEQPLSPIRDGYCITRSEKQDEMAGQSQGSDYNIVHTKWQLTYRIDEPERFFKNVFIEDVKPGEVYFEVIKKSVTPLLKRLFEDAVVTTMVNYTIDDAMYDQVGKVTDDVKERLQYNLKRILSPGDPNKVPIGIGIGIGIRSVRLDDITWPRQVNEAFRASIGVSQTSQTAISEAKTSAESTLIEAAGLVEEKLAEAKAYRTSVVKSAEANASYFIELLPQYRRNPEIVIQQIYQDTIEHVVGSAGEKIVVPPGPAGEFRLIISSDPELKRKTYKKKPEE